MPGRCGTSTSHGQRRSFISLQFAQPKPHHGLGVGLEPLVEHESGPQDRQHGLFPLMFREG